MARGVNQGNIAFKSGTEGSIIRFTFRPKQRGSDLKPFADDGPPIRKDRFAGAQITEYALEILKRGLKTISGKIFVPHALEQEAC